LIRARSDYWRAIDEDFLQAELDAEGLDEPRAPRRTNRFGFDIHKPESWYRTSEGRRVLDIVLSFQTPSGGWSKRTDMGHRPRQPGEHFGNEFHYVPTFDNDATTTQIVILARAYNATGHRRYLEAYTRGVALILEAQYPNGGWPQSFPLQGDYHDCITLNDETLENNLTLLYQLSRGSAPFESAPPELRERAKAALHKGLALVVAAQVVVEGTPTIWSAQYEPRSLAPRPARAYEMVSLAPSESVSLLHFLMQMDNPSARIQNAVHSAVDWYEQNKIIGYVWDTDTREVYADESAPPLWPRFAEIGTNRPLFGDRDGSVHYSVEDISQERRDGYGWYTTAPNRVLERYQQWRERYPRRKTR